jgi:hypothetical protein
MKPSILSPVLPSPAPIVAKAKSTLLTDLVLSLCVVLVFMAIAYWKSVDPDSLPWLRHDFRSHIGAEYDCIAQAIRKGRGFSDPFQIETGPTAWMPPVLPYLMAGIYWAHGDDRAMVIFWMVAIQGLSTWLACLIVFRESRRLQHRFAGVNIVVALYATNMFQLFQQTHDTGLLLLVVSLLWLGLRSLGFQPGETHSQARSLGYARFTQIMWGASGAFFTLCSPIIGGAWFVLTFWSLRPKRKEWITGSRLTIVLGVWLLLISPWTIRNYMEFGKWFPIKPNCMYELWQSHCKDDDGVLDAQSINGHPWSSSGEQRTRYQEIGEMAFIEEKGIDVRKSIRENPMGLVERITNRGVASLVLYTSFSQMEEYFAGGWPTFFARCVHPLPLVGILLFAVFGAIPISRTALMTVGLFGLLLLPYVLVSYYDRYAATLVGLKMLLVLYGWDACQCRKALRAVFSARKAEVR